MITQSFLYNAIFFTYTLVLTKFYGVSANNAPYYLIAFAAGNLIGPLTIGRLFDTIGRKQMIAGTYITSGVLLAVTAYLFDQGTLTATTQTIAWCVIFFFASSGASAAYLTVSEIFPLEGAGPGDRGVLRHRAVLRRAGAGAVRAPDRDRQRPV
jgi:MFS family permease